MRLSKLEMNQRDIMGIIETGASGLQADLYDTEINRVSYIRLPHHAEMYPFYFLVHLRANEQLGIAILQRFHNFGVRTLLFRRFAEYFKSLIPQAVFEMRPIAESSVLQQFMQDGRLTKIHVIKYGIPSDKADQIGLGHEEQPGTL